MLSRHLYGLGDLFDIEVPNLSLLVCVSLLPKLVCFANIDTKLLKKKSRDTLYKSANKKLQFRLSLLIFKGRLQEILHFDC